MFTAHTTRATARQIDPSTYAPPRQAVRSYRRRAAGLDQKYAQEVVGDGTNGQVGPFETALGEFYTGNVLPVAVGAFSEVNEDASKLITRLARLTAKTDFGKSMSPLVSHSRKGAHGRLPNHAVPVQACPRVPDSQGAGARQVNVVYYGHPPTHFWLKYWTYWTVLPPSVQQVYWTP
ncbi:hypothetical protein THAOC_10667 [Thalassiosira oceanica]|uniref:Uncharacterized protein n=1 Tax=Thalassiosira oceanica TaxID=159749 RepID=K0TCJ3_THAOC|nr:hypothetical protein THAOC_10667 [Thalassiosira oceanica]|eukprot:EJK68177.1 hypothetical protein THAOC_10667 [Thalassiosira oceanica]